MKYLSIVALVALSASNFKCGESFSFQPKTSTNLAKVSVSNEVEGNNFNDVLGKCVAAALVSLAVMAGPSPALADGKNHFYLVDDLYRGRKAPTYVL